MLLLHGAGKSRRDWHATGYVTRLAERFTVIAVDLRGAGDSDILNGVSDYAVDKILADVTAVADACAAERFLVCGYSFGGQVGKYLAARMDRVSALAVIGVPLWGPTVDESFDRFITEFERKWKPVVESLRADGAGAKTKKSAIKGRVPALLACFQAMREWPTIEPGGIRCPSIVIIGTRNNTGALEWAETTRDALLSGGVQIEVIEGLNHLQEFSEIDRVFPVVR